VKPHAPSDERENEFFTKLFSRAETSNHCRPAEPGLFPGVMTDSYTGCSELPISF
jgi:hypothetical protein